MKKMALVFIALLCSAWSLVAVSANQYQQGKNYEVISNQLSSKPNVTEVFSFYCAACYGFEHVAKGIKKALPDGVAFNKSHVDFMPSASAATQQMLTRALVVSNMLKLDHKVIDAIFNHIHQDKKKFNSQADVRQLFVANGVEGKAFDGAMKSFYVKGAANQMKNYQDKLTASKVLDGIPLFVVNGKYRVIREGLRNQQDYDNLIAHLLTLK